MATRKGKKPPQRFMGVDQFGNTYHGLKNPRKDLIDKIGSKSVSKMYVDKKSGGTKHVGYVVGRHWVSVYKVSEWKGE